MNMDRIELLPHVGQPVHVTARVDHVGRLSFRNEPDERTVLLREVNVEGSDAQFEHTWLRLGATASDRITRVEDQIIGAQIRFDAVVGLYRHRSGNSLRLGFTGAHNITASIGGKEKLLARAPTTYREQKAARDEWGLIEQVHEELRMELQRPIMERLSDAVQGSRVDKSIAGMLARYFTRGCPVTDPQLQHAVRFLNS